MKDTMTAKEVAARARKHHQISETPDGDFDTARQVLKEKEAKEAVKRYKRLLAEKALEEQIVEHFSDHVQRMMGDGRMKFQFGPPKNPTKGRSGHPEEANLVISDSHAGKLVEPRHTLGFGHYNPRIFLERLSHLEQAVTRLLQQNIANPIQRLNVLFLGDLVEGMLNHNEEIPGREEVADQVLLAGTAFFQFIAKLSRIVPVTCRGLTGNHARWPNQKRSPTHGRWSNLDFIVLGQIQQLIEASGLDNTKFLLEENAFQVFNVFDWRIKIGHGDHLRGGDRAMGVPSHAIGREINATTQRYAARLATALQNGSIKKLADVKGQLPPDYYIVGDKHRHMSLSTARGRFMVNGAFFEADSFAMTENFPPGRPYQLFFGMHPKIGKSWSYDLMLDIAPSMESIPYQLSGRMQEKLAKYF